MSTVASPPFSRIEPVTEILHGVPVTDPYRWLEDQDSPQTRAWIGEQTRYARAHLDSIPERDKTRRRIAELVDVETYDSFLKAGTRYFFRKRLPGQEQPCIYFREGPETRDELLVDPSQRGTGEFTAVKPLRASPDGNLLLYEVKKGGERTGTFEILDVRNHVTLPDSLSHGYLRGFAFAPDSRSFYYVHEPTAAKRPFYRAAYWHVLGTSSEKDREILCAGEDRRIRLAIVPGPRQLGLLVYCFLDKTYSDFYIWRMGGTEPPVSVVRGSDYSFAPCFLHGRILALTDRDAPNRRIVEVQPRNNQDPLFFNLVGESDAAIQSWLVTAQRIFVSYAPGASTQIRIFDSFGKPQGQIPCDPGHTIRLITGDTTDDDILIERESFTRPLQTDRYSAPSRTSIAWAKRHFPFPSTSYTYTEARFPSKDGTRIPLFLVGRPDLLTGGPHPTILTSYGGFGVPMTPQFSIFVAFLLERGCLFALPNIRGGCEFGTEWHAAAKRRNRQVAIDDFLSAAEWLIETGKAEPGRLAIFGGSNSGLLVGAAMTQKPELFRAVVCMVPMLDMLRYHLFDNAYVWADEFGVADDPEDFSALYKYSPYHNVSSGVAYPATLLVSGDADRNCNPLHARKMTARLQAANASPHPILLEYNRFRGHSPVLPLSVRIAALTDRMAFLSDQLRLSSKP